ncbi:MAG: class I SAM-dependent methyltransferase [Cyanobacteriota bacterium]|nr:class I SAM-dependent methyltransferase [Cyanobacteriota bacterium]
MKISAQSAMYAKHAQLMDEQKRNYFDCPNQDVLSLIPMNVERVLEIGCGAGATLRAFKEDCTVKGRTCEVVGIDIEAGAVAQGRQYLDAMYLMNIEEDELTNYPHGYFDLIIMNFVLEHVVNPWATLRKWLQLLRVGGYAIIGVPNIANFRFLRRLLLNDEFTYEPEGILDWTHLRYFTESSLKKLLLDTGLSISLCQGLPKEGQFGRGKKGYLVRLFPSLKRFGFYAYVVLAQKETDISDLDDYIPFEKTYTL